MGFALFDQSGVFNPLDYGLGVGDRLEVMCVGGGGGGGTSSGSDTSGGNGGPSSFGSYITALGGYGCSASTASTGKWRGTPTQYMTMGCAGTGYCSNTGVPGYNSYGGGGGGGWWYDAPRLHAVPSISLTKQGGSSADTDHVIPVNLDRGAGTAGVNGFHCSNQYPNTSHFSINWSTHSMWQPIIQYMSSETVYGVFVPGIPVAGGTSWYNTNSYNSDLLPYPTHTTARAHYYGTGGLGYGAGGGSQCGTSTYRPGGCGGELRRASVILSSVEPISVSVGGGGSGGCAYRFDATSSCTAYNGLDGSAGTAGAAAHQYGCPGGYGTSIPVPKQSVNNDHEACYVGGGGAGGCVAIWW